MGNKQSDKAFDKSHEPGDEPVKESVQDTGDGCSAGNKPIAVAIHLDLVLAITASILAGLFCFARLY